VAGFAAEHGVLSQQWEFTQFVVETNPFLPGPVVVAACAVLTECALMNVILAVATMAIGLQLAIFDATDMAGLADQFRMSTPQRKPGFCVMVEGCQMPSLDVVAVTALFTV
jgi:hypothetical protein